MPLPLRSIRDLRAYAVHCITAALALFCAFSTAVAGPGHAGDEGHSHDGPAARSAQSPRVVATSESFQLVGILKAGKLTLYLDREPDNVPVTDAKITLGAGNSSVEATANQDGTYEVAAGEWAKPGENEMQFTIEAADKHDLLAGVLIVPSATGHAPAAAKPFPADLRAHLPPLRQVFGGALLLASGVVIGLLMARRRVAVAAVLLAALCISVLPAPQVSAGPGHAGDEGHSHGPEAGTGLSDTASRLPDGSVFVPKPTQRLIEVRTGLATTSQSRRHVRLSGRVASSGTGPVIDVALYDQVDPDAISAGQAVAPSGARSSITLATRGTELKLNALPLTFSLAGDAPAALRVVGQRVTIILETGDPIAGIVLPRATVVTAPNGQSVVFEHTEPERFTPKQVLYAPLDTERVIVTSGLADGDKIVLQAAGLINQVR